VDCSTRPRGCGLVREVKAQKAPSALTLRWRDRRPRESGSSTRAKVTRSAFAKRRSIAPLLLTTEALIREAEPPEPVQHATDHGDMG